MLIENVEDKNQIPAVKEVQQEVEGCLRNEYMEFVLEVVGHYWMIVWNWVFYQGEAFYFVIEKGKEIFVQE